MQTITLFIKLHISKNELENQWSQREVKKPTNQVRYLFDLIIKKLFDCQKRAAGKFFSLSFAEKQRPKKERKLKRRDEHLQYSNLLIYNILECIWASDEWWKYICWNIPITKITTEKPIKKIQLIDLWRRKKWINKMKKKSCINDWRDVFRFSHFV